MMLDVDSIQYSYHRHPVLSSISFNLNPGDIMAVLGINGAGKSTLLKCLNRVLKTHGGRISLAEKNVADMTANRLACHFGYVPQHAGQEQLTVFDSVLLGRRPHMKWSATRNDLIVVEQVLQLMDLLHLAQRPANRLSGGELQKVLIARALAQEPDILLLDEPTSNLDMKNQIQVMNLVTNAVRERGISAIVSVHDINLALRYTNRFLLMKEGQVLSMTTSEHITPELIRDVYGVDVIISQISNQTVVVPISAHS